jgi:capsular exopolysaccharide synthesis family protein
MDSVQSPPEARLHFLDYWRVIKTRKAIVFVVFLLVVLVAATFTFFQPKIYMSSVRIKVEQEHPTVAVFEQQYVPSYDPFFLQTQYEVLQSQKVLYPVIERLNLQSRESWLQNGQQLPKEVLSQRLKAMLGVRRYRDTSLIEITVQDGDRMEAAEIANTIAEVFESEQLEVKRQQTMKGIEKIRDELAQQQEKVRLAQKKVEDLRRELNVPVFGTVKLDDQAIQHLDQELTTARVEAVSRETRLKELQKLSLQQLRNTIATIISDPNVQTLLQNLTDAERKLEVLKEDYGPDHPNVRAAIAERDKLQTQLDARLEGVMRGFEVEYQMAQARVTELQKQLDDLKAASLDLASDRYLPFHNAEREEESETKLYDNLKARLEQTSIELEIPRSPIEVVDLAQPSAVPVSPNVWRNVVMGTIVGLFLGVGLSFFIEFLDTSVKRMEDVERFLDLPVLGVVPQEAGLLSGGAVSPGHLEAYRMLRTNIEYAKRDGAVRSLCVLSAGAGEGKSFTVANLAYVYAQQGSRVLVVDSDLRRPGIHQFFGVSNAIGLAEYLGATETLEEIILPTNVPNVSIITSGGGGKPKSALPLLTSHRMEELIAELSKRFDIVLYDTPPALGVSDATIMAREVGTSILVIQHRRFPRAMPLRARQLVENAGGKLLGVVVNNVNIGQDETYYYYYHEHYDQYLHAPASAPSPSASEKKKGEDDQIEPQGKY